MSVKATYQALLKAKRPIDFFGKLTTSSELKALYKQYAKQIHPDKVSDKEKYLASEAFSILNKLYNLGLKEIAEGIYNVFNPIILYKNQKPLFEIEVAKKVYQFYENVFEGEVAYIFRGLEKDNIVYLKVAIDSADNSLIQEEYKILEEHRHQSLPYVEEKIRINDAEAIIMREIKGITMLELLNEYPKGVPAEHVMWMMERLLSVVGFLHSNCVVHGNIKPENIIIDKTTHNVSLLGLSFAISEANTSKAEYKIVNDLYTAPEVKKGIAVEPSTDIYAVGKLAIKLLGGNVSNNGMPIAVNQKVRSFIRKMVETNPTKRPRDAWKLWTELIQLRTEVYGTQRFQTLV